MRLNGRMVAAALTGVLVAGGTLGGYLLSAGTAKADNATQCQASPASGGLCSILSTTLPATANVYLQFNPNFPSYDSAKAQVTWTAVCDGTTLQNVQSALPPNVLYLDQNYAKSCTVTAHLQVFFGGPLPPKGTLEYVTMQLDYTTPFDTPSAAPSHNGGGGSGGFNGAVKGFAGKCLDDAANSSHLRAKVDIWSCNRGNSQKWGYSKGEITHNGLCLNAKSDGKVILWSCNAAANETWFFNTINHEVILKAHGFGQCLTDPGSSTRNGTQVTWAACKNSASQHWSLPGH